MATADITVKIDKEAIREWLAEAWREGFLAGLDEAGPSIEDNPFETEDN